MKNNLKISLKPNEKIYINGAVIKVDRKVSFEFLNDVHFLLENHVLQAEDATTPLRQLYFIVQVMLMDPGVAPEARDLFRKSLPLLLDTFEDEDVRSALKQIDRLIGEDRVFEALKEIRALYEREDQILQSKPASEEPLRAEPLPERHLRAVGEKYR